MSRVRRVAAYLVALLGMATTLHAENIVFPADANIRDVTKPPYNAKKDGSEDARPAIIKALTDSLDPNQQFYLSRLRNLIIYFPNGTYLVSDSITWGTDGRTRPFNGIIMQGQSRDGVILKFPDNMPSAQVATSRFGLFRTGVAPAQRFRNSIRNMTISIGRGNTYACGVQFNASNFGTIQDVKIISEDRAGYAGLDMGFTNEIGPLLVKNLTVEGFDVGILTINDINSQTFEHITVSGQKRFGFYISGQAVSMRNFKSTNSVPAIYIGGNSAVALVDAEMNAPAGTDTSAIVNARDAHLFVRNIKSTGYAHVLNNLDVTKPGKFTSAQAQQWEQKEYFSRDPVSLFESPKVMLNLPIEETPDVPWDELSQWSNVCSFGAIPGDGLCDADAIQAAIDGGKTTVYFPRGNYHIGVGKTIEVRGNVRRIIGCEASLAKFIDPEKIGPALLVKDGPGLPPVVVFERIEAGTGTKQPFFEMRALNRTLVIKNSSGKIDSYGGKIFIEDVTTSDCVFRNTKVWARQLNIENNWFESDTRSKFLNDNSHVWVLGYKTERDGSLARTINGGKTEIIGGFSYTTIDPKMTPMFVNELSHHSIVIADRAGRGKYDTLVAESRHCDNSVRYFHTKSPNWVQRGGGSMLFYTGYCRDATCGCQKIGVVNGVRHNTMAVGLPSRLVQFDPKTSSTILVPANKRGFDVFDLKGAKVWTFSRDRVGTTAEVRYPDGLGKGIRTIKYFD